MSKRVFLARKLQLGSIKKSPQSRNTQDSKVRNSLLNVAQQSIAVCLEKKSICYSRPSYHKSTGK